jgi:hypothetical protein
MGRKGLGSSLECAGNCDDATVPNMCDPSRSPRADIGRRGLRELGGLNLATAGSVSGMRDLLRANGSCGVNHGKGAFEAGDGGRAGSPATPTTIGPL